MSKDSAQKLLDDVGLPKDFLDHLLHESDWSMIIKLHALFEAVLAGLVVKRLQNPAIQEAVVHLEFNHAKSGKVAFARALKLIGAKEAAFLRGLSELRNNLVHDVRNVKFEFRSYISGLDANQRKKFKSEFGKSICALPNGEDTYKNLLKTQPAHIIFLAAYSCLITLELNLRNSKRDLVVQALLARLAKNV
jgi:hypothetical protein